MEGLGVKIAACIVTLLVGVVLPLVIAAVFAWKRREDGIWRAWMIGAAGFLIPQLVIRPLFLMALSGTGYAAWAESNPLAYTVVTAFFVALLELAGRCAGAGLLRKDLTFTQALAAGLGHGGIESIILIGISYVNNLMLLVMLQNGQFDAMLAEAAANGTDTAVLTMICQTCMTVMVFYGFHQRKALPWLAGCAGTHFLIDCIALINQVVSVEWVAYTIIYILLALAAVLCLVLLLKIRTRWSEEDTAALPREDEET